MSALPASLHATLRAAMTRWSLAADGPVHESQSGCVAPVRRAGAPCVVKISSPQSDEGNAAAALAHFGGRGAVRLLDHAGPAMLLERLAPGTALTKKVVAGDDDGATAILCNVMQALQRGPCPVGGFPTVEDWAESFDDYHRSDGPLAASLVARAATIYRDLCRSQGERVLLHGDLHHDNVLHDARRGWLAVDPKGVVGERAYETGALLRNPAGHPARFAAPAIVDRRARILCERLGLDRARVLGWCFAQAVLAAIWAVEDGTEDRQGMITAAAVLPLL